ncbi:MAG: PEP-CTERM/exosortase system-associated acyltransferase [Pseudomonadota bacterium]
MEKAAPWRHGFSSGTIRHYRRGAAASGNESGAVMASVVSISRQDAKDRGQDGELAAIYNALFEVIDARSEEERRAAFTLRYEVYIAETGFLSADDNPPGLETDALDARSGHSLLIHRPTGCLAGTMRIIPPQAGAPGCGLPARQAAAALDQLDDAILPKARTGEISRFSIAQRFRRRSGDGLYPDVFERSAAAAADPRRVIPHIALGLMTGVFDQVLKFGLSHLCAIIDPALLRLLRRLGIEFQAVGAPVEFHGLRQPVYARCQDLVAHLRFARPEIYRVISRDGRLALPE